MYKTLALVNTSEFFQELLIEGFYFSFQVKLRCRLSNLNPLPPRKAALLQHSERFAGLVLDVFEHEPLDASSPLWQLPNALLSSHNADLVERNLMEVLFALRILTP